MKKIVFAIGMLVCGISTGIHAASTCSGTITKVGVQNNGGIRVSTSGGTTYNSMSVCSLNVSSGGITAQSCKAIYATLLTAVAANKKVSFTLQANNACTGAWKTLTTDPNYLLTYVYLLP